MFNAAKCRVVDVATQNAGRSYGMGGSIPASRKSAMGLGVTGDQQLSMSAQCNTGAKRANTIVRCIRRGVASRSREMVSPRGAALV